MSLKIKLHIKFMKKKHLFNVIESPRGSYKVCVR